MTAEEGPCLDVCTTPVVPARAFPDDRWPILGDAPLQHGVQSAVSYQLGASGEDAGRVWQGSLNAYGRTPESIDDAAKEIGLILAAHTSLAARAVDERSRLESIGRQLHQALFARDVIGQAKGIQMERLKITPEDAFDILRHSSQQLNLKLRDVARPLTETGEV